MTRATGFLRGILATCLVIGAGCQRQKVKPDETHEEHGSDPHADDKGEAEHAKAAKADPGVLRVDPAMVRDLRLTTKSVESRPGGEEITLLGELQPDQEAYAEVGTPIEGRVSRLTAGPGDIVKPGAPLVEIESVTLGRARAAEITARARADLSRQIVERKRRLVAENLAPGRELDEAEAEAKAAEAEWRGAGTTLRAFGVSAEGGSGSARFVLRAPIGGTVLERKAARGQLVDPEEPLFRIADLRSLWLTVQAFERDALRVKVGSPARVAFPALPGRTFSGKVVLVGSQVDVASRTIPVRVTVENEGALLRPGMSASAWLPVAGATAAVIAVPTAAVQRLDRDWVVFVPRAERHSFEIRQVGRGRDLGGEVEIVSHLRAGETVVVDGAFLLKAQAEKARGMGEQHEH